MSSVHVLLESELWQSCEIKVYIYSLWKKERNLAGILFEIALKLYVYQVGKNWHADNIESIYEYEISLYLFFNLIYQNFVDFLYNLIHILVNLCLSILFLHGNVNGTIF